MPPYNLKEDFWEIKTCQPGLNLEVHDIVTFGTDAITVQHVNNQSFTWASCTYDPDYFHAQATTLDGTQTAYDIVLDSQGKYVTCSPAAPTFILAGMGHQGGIGNAATKGVSQQIASMLCGIALGTAATGLAGLPLWGGLLVTGVTTLGQAGALYLLRIWDGDDPNSEAQGSSWTAQGGNGNPPPPPPYPPPAPTLT